MPTNADKNFLVIDTAYSGFTVALSVAGNLYTHQEETARDQATNLLPAIDMLLKAASLDKQALDFVVVTKGPGSFTGIRLGLAAAQALALSLGIKVYALTVFDILNAMGEKVINKGDHYFVCMATQRDYYYAQSFFPKKSEIKLLNREQIIEMVVGEGMTHYIGNTHLDFVEALQTKSGSAPCSGHIYTALSGKDYVDHVSKLDFSNDDEYGDINPVYLRAADVSVSKKRQRILK